MIDSISTVGIAYTPADGWRCYLENFDGTGRLMFMSAKRARHMVKKARKGPEARDPKYAAVFSLFDELMLIADEVDETASQRKFQKNF